MSLPVAMGGLFMAGQAIKARGQQVSGINEQRAFNQRSFVAGLSSQDLRFQSELTRTSTRIEARRLRDKIDVNRGAQRAAVAAQGVELSGSALQVLGRTAAQQEQDLLSLRFSGEARASALARDAETARESAQVLRNEGTVARQSARARGGATLLTGFTSALRFGSQLGGA